MAHTTPGALPGRGPHDSFMMTRRIAWNFFGLNVLVKKSEGFSSESELDKRMRAAKRDGPRPHAPAGQSSELQTTPWREGGEHGGHGGQRHDAHAGEVNAAKAAPEHGGGL